MNIGISVQNSRDWERLVAEDWSRPPETPDWKCVEAALEIADLAEPLGFDGIWAPEHFGTPYGMCPNPLQTLAYFAGRTERVTFGTMVAVAPWWNPVRLAHQIAYLDVISKGRYETIGLGRGVAKSEFESLGVPREESRERFNETIDIIKLAFTQERFTYDGEIFKIPETSLRPQTYSPDLCDRIYGSAATPESLEILSRKGLVPLFVGNKPIEAAGEEVRQVNAFRAEEGFAPCQPKNVMFMYCSNDPSDVARTSEWMWTANRDVTLHYKFADPSNFVGVKGYEAYASRAAAATAVLASAVTGNNNEKPKMPGYHPSNLLIGNPDQVIERIIAAQKACGFSELTLVPNFGTMPYEDAVSSVRLFAEEVLPVVHQLDASLSSHLMPKQAAA